MKEKYKISIESDGAYDETKKFCFKADMTPEEFLSICDVIVCEFPHLQSKEATPSDPSTSVKGSDGV